MGISLGSLMFLGTFHVEGRDVHDGVGDEGVGSDIRL